jgi:hypothetical protein
MSLSLPLRQVSQTLSPVSASDILDAAYEISGTAPKPDWVPVWWGLIQAVGWFGQDPVAEWMVRNDSPPVIAELTFRKQIIGGPAIPEYFKIARKLWFCEPAAWLSLSDYLGKLTSVDHENRTVACTFLHKSLMIDPRDPFEFPGKSWLTSWVDFVKTGIPGDGPKPLVLDAVGLATAKHTWHLVPSGCPYVEDAGPDAHAVAIQKAYFGPHNVIR